MGENPFLEVIKIKNFLKVWGSQIFTLSTINLVNFVIILRIYEATHSSVAVSLVWLFYAIPCLVLGPFSGTIVDLFPKRKLLWMTNLLQGVIILFYLLVKHKLWPIYTVIFFYSLVDQLYMPAEAAAIPWVVPKKLLAVANSLFLFTLYGAFLVGFGLAGPLVRLVGKELPFVIGSVFLFLATFLVSRLPQEKLEKKKKIRDLADFWQVVKEGYVFIKGNSLVFYPLLLLIFAQVVVGVIVILAPSLASEILYLDLLDAGPAMALPAGIGALVGSQVIVRLIRQKMRKRKIISFGFFLTAFSLLFLALVVPNLGRFRLFWAVSSALLLGLSFVSIIVPVQTLLQESTPEDKRGRVFGVLGFAITLASVVPILFAATVADILGINFVLMMMAGIIGFLGFYSLRDSDEIYVNNQIKP